MSTEIYLGNPPENIKKWIKEEAERKYQEMLKTPIHFTANEPNSSVSLRANEYGDQGESWCSFVYSTDGMKTWNDYLINSTDDKDKTIQLDECENKTVYFKAKYGNTEDNPNRNGLTDYTWMFEHVYEYSLFHQFVADGSIKASGNIQFLLDNTGSRMDVPHHCYANLFESCEALTQAHLILPATKLADCCYEFMFMQCTALTQVQLILPATTLAYGCYSCMFVDCRSLTQAPKLLATTLADVCYSCMFSGCSSLTKAPEFPATFLADSYCYDNMFQDCKSPFTFSDKTFDEVANLIQEQYLIGTEYWCYYDEEGNEIIINPIEIICSDKTMLATCDENEYTWILTEK